MISSVVQRRKEEQLCRKGNVRSSGTGLIEQNSLTLVLLGQTSLVEDQNLMVFKECLGGLVGL